MNLLSTDYLLRYLQITMDISELGTPYFNQNHGKQ